LRESTAAIIVGGAASFSLAAAAAYLMQQKNPQGGSYQVEVTVIGNGVPFQNATVTLASAVQQTNANGVATFGNVKGGIYALQVIAVGYPTYSQQVGVAVGATSFTVDLNSVVCEAKTCPCGQIWDSTLCQCSNLIPAAVLANISVNVNLAWQVRVSCLTGSCQPGIISDNPTSCPGAALTPDFNPSLNSWTMRAVGQVVDSGGNGICNQVVLATYPNTSFPWTTPDGLLAGNLVLEAGSSDVTDNAGDFVFNIVARLDSVHTVNNDLLACLAGQGGGPVSFTIPVSYRLQGTVIQATTVISLHALVCGVFLVAL